MNTVIELLEHGRAKIAQGACRKFTAVDAEGRSVKAKDPLAVAWCVFGALWSAVPAGSALACKAQYALEKACPGYPPTWQDELGRTQHEVLDLYDRAIAAEKAKAP